MQCQLRFLLPAVFLSALTVPGVTCQEVWTQAELERTSAEISKEVEGIRGKKFLRPVAMKITDKAGFLTHAKERMAVMVTPEELAGNETMAKMLGLIPPDLDLMKKTFDVLEEQVGGFYVPGENTFYIMDRFVGPMANVILAHELTHALDDQLYDIDDDMRTRAAESDAGAAYAAVVEGSGTNAMNQYSMAHVDMLKGMDPESMKELQSMGMESMADAPAFIWVPLISAYLRGSSFLVRSDNLMKGQMKAATPEDLERAFTDPPKSSEQVLHPAKYWEAETRDEPRQIQFETSKLPQGWKVVHEDTLGEIHLALLTTPGTATQGFSDPLAVMTMAYTNSAAEGWGGDRLVVLQKDEARVLELVTLWDTERDAAEFYGALSVLLPGLETNLDRLGKIWGCEKGSERARTSLQYGSRGDEVVLVLAVGVRSSKLDDLCEALVHTEMPAGGR
jgi:hypothetical protein